MFVIFLAGLGCGLVIGYYVMMIGIKTLLKSGKIKLGDS